MTVGRTTEGDILRSKEKWMSHERSGRAAKYGKSEEALMLWFNKNLIKKKSCNYIFEMIKSCNYIFEII